MKDTARVAFWSASFYSSVVNKHWEVAVSLRWSTWLIYSSFQNCHLSQKIYQVCLPSKKNHTALTDVRLQSVGSNCSYLTLTCHEHVINTCFCFCPADFRELFLWPEFWANESGAASTCSDCGHLHSGTFCHILHHLPLAGCLPCHQGQTVMVEH